MLCRPDTKVKHLQKCSLLQYSHSIYSLCQLLRFRYNMALRNTDLEDGKQKEGSSAVAGLTPYWNDPPKKPSNEWKKWNDLLAVAMTAKNSISIQEVLRVVPNETERNKALLNNLDHPVAERKCVSVLYVSLGRAARKTFTDKYPTIKVEEITLADLLKNCKETFDAKRNRTLDRFRLLSRKQMPSETLSNFGIL